MSTQAMATWILKNVILMVSESRLCWETKKKIKHLQVTNLHDGREKVMRV